MMERNSSLKLTPSRHSWLFSADIQRLFGLFRAAGGELRVVGGAVRNALLDVPISDIDFAVNLPPERAEAVLLQAGVKTVRTGFSHGTITAVIKGHGYEITSLRRDIGADGRRATVAYGDDWAEDAARRDFTMNALYADAEGRIYDDHGGAADAQAGRVRFIGAAEERIKEDYLRIPRFFRFHAWYGHGALDADGLAACGALASGLALLSRERVTQEFGKLLLAPRPMPSLRAMRDKEILPRILPLALDLDRLERLLAPSRSAAVGLPLRLAALLPRDRRLEPVLRAALRLSNAELRDVLALCGADFAVTAEKLAELLYRHGAALLRDLVLLQAADDPALPLDEWLARIDAWKEPVFPLCGADFLALGLTPSPELGALLQAVEDWWIAAGFMPDHAACLAEAGRRLPR